MPKTAPKNHYNAASIRLPRGLVGVIRRLAAANHRSLNGQINVMISEWLAANDKAS